VVVDPRTDRERLRTVAYGTGDFLANRTQLYRFAEPRREPITDWLYNLVGGAAALVEPIVDLGAGNGQYVFALPGRRVLGLDLSPGMLTGIRAAGFDGPLVEADAQATPLAGGSAGTVLANHMLYHVPDIALACLEFRRILRPGGTLLAITNGLEHVAELDAVFNGAVGALGGGAFHLDRSATRFNLENGDGFLRAAFDSVERHDLRTELVVPDVEPVMRYLASMVGLAPTLPNGIEFNDVLAAAEPVVEETVARTGCFRVNAHVGAFICR
jgi:SAM-dependent methyltransferase